MQHHYQLDKLQQGVVVSSSSNSYLTTTVTSDPCHQPCLVLQEVSGMFCDSCAVCAPSISSDHQVSDWTQVVISA